MKKLFTLLFLLPFCLLQAQTDYYTIPGYQAREMITEFTPGEPVVLQPFRADTCMFYNGENFYPYGYSFQIDNRGLFVFEEAGEDADGYMTYFMKNYVTGLYLRDCAYGDGNVDVYYDQKTTARAQRVYVFATRGTWVSGRKPADYDPRWYARAYSGQSQPENTFIITLADKPDSRSNVWLSPTIWSEREAGVHFNSDAYTTTWYFWHPEKVSGRARLEATVGKTYGKNEGEFNITYLPRGNWQLYVPQSFRDEALSLYTEAKAMLADAATAEADCEAEAIKVQKAYDKYLQQGINNYNARASVFEFSPTYNSGFTYKDLPIARSTYEDPGLVTDSTQLWSNSKYEKAGSYYGLIDGDLNTYFRANANSADQGNMYYYIAADLRKEVQDITFKYTIEGQTNSSRNSAPRSMHVYASDDGSDWKTEGYVYFSTTLPATLDVWFQNQREWKLNETMSDWSGMASFHLSRPYRYIRLDAETTQWGNPDMAENYYWALAELHFYETPVDEALSLNNIMDAGTFADFQQQLNKLNAELSDSLATSEQLDRFAEACDRFVSEFPVMSKVTEAIALAQSVHDSATEDQSDEGGHVGLFQPGSKAVLQAAIDAVEAEVSGRKTMTMDEIRAVTAKLDAALAEFNDKLNKPIDGHYYQIRSVSEMRNKSTYDWYIYAPDNDESQIRLGGHDTDNDSDDEHLKSRLNFYWRAIKTGDDTYKFQNVGTGTYLGSGFASDVTADMSFSDDNVVTLKTAGSGSAFNILFADNVYAYAEGLYHTLITWDTAQGADYGAFVFVDATYEWNNGSWIDARKPRFLTLPYTIVGGYEGETLLLDGYNPATNTLEFSEFDFMTTLEPGKPFLLVPAEMDGAVTGVELEPDFGHLDEFEYAFEPSSHNGLQGTVASVENNGYLVLDAAAESLAINVSAKKRIAANSAYLSDLFNPDVVPQVSEAGDVSIAVSDAVTGLLNPIRNQKAAVTYDLQGRRVQNAAKGVYIRGTQKVLVK